VLAIKVHKKAGGWKCEQRESHWQKTEKTGGRREQQGGVEKNWSGGIWKIAVHEIKERDAD